MTMFYKTKVYILISISVYLQEIRTEQERNFSKKMSILSIFIISSSKNTTILDNLLEY